MRKFFQDYSFNGVVLILCTLVLGFMFRLASLPEASAWGDEIASLFYAENLSEVFLHESHTPLYYFICKCWMLIFGKSVIALRYLFVTLSFVLLSLTSFLLLKNKKSGMFLLFVVLWWLWPTDVIFSRQARHYGLYAELSFFFLIFWRFREDTSGKMLFIVSAIAQFLHPFLVILVWFLALYDFIRKRVSQKTLILSLSSSLPVFLYYLARFFSQGQAKVMSNISWITDDTVAYLKGLLLLFGGDSYPLNQFHPLSVGMTLLFLGLVIFIVLFKTRPREDLLKFFIILVLSFIFTELVSRFFSNIRVARYCLYLVPFLLYALLDSVKEEQLKLNYAKAFVLLLLLASYQLFILKPWTIFPWDDQNVAEVKEILKTLPERELVVCGNRYQLNYYFQKPNLTCSQVAIPLLREKKPFYFFDINGTEKLLGAYLLQEAEITSLKKIRHATLLTVDPRR